MAGSVARSFLARPRRPRTTSPAICGTAAPGAPDETHRDAPRGLDRLDRRGDAPGRGLDRLDRRPTPRLARMASEQAGWGSTRSAVVWTGLEPALRSGPRDVLDIGGGTGGLAVRIGALGHRVTVVDPSPDALAALDRRAREHDVAVTGRQGDLSSLLDVVGPDSADVVLCHGVLEVVDDPAAALATLASVVRPGGLLSLLAAQRH